MTKTIEEKMQHRMDINNQRADLNLDKLVKFKDTELFEILERGRDKWRRKKHKENVAEILGKEE